MPEVTFLKEGDPLLFLKDSTYLWRYGNINIQNLKNIQTPLRRCVAKAK